MNKLAFIYPGQGAQKPGMGKDFYDKYDTVKKIYDEASEMLHLDMKKLCFEENDKLDKTEYTQAALMCTCLSMEAVLKENNIQPDITAGLSLGEYAAIATSGGMQTQDAIKVVRSRGILMEEAVPAGVGAMSAVLGLSSELLDRVLADIPDVQVANYNCPGQIVITGKSKAVLEASQKLTEAGAKRVLPLNVSGPFHSDLLRGAGDKLKKILETVTLNQLKIPYVTNVNAKIITDISQTKELLAKQVFSSVMWQQSVNCMIAYGVDTFVEIGPGKTLASFIKKINRDVTVHNIQNTEDLDRVRSVYNEAKYVG